MCNHPIATSSPPSCFDGRVHEYAGDHLDVRALGAWLTKRVGLAFDYRPGFSRLEGARCVFFPRRPQSGIHCVWVEEVPRGEQD